MTLTHDQKVDFMTAVYKCLELAAEKFGIDMDDVVIDFNAKGQVSAYAYYQNGVYGLSFNPEAVEKYTEDMIKDTIPHEVAHLVGFKTIKYGIKGHNKNWKAATRMLGGSGERCHTYKLTPARKRTIHRYLYTTPSGVTIQTTAQKHNKIQSGHIFRVNRTGEYLLAEHFAGKKVFS